MRASHYAHALFESLKDHPQKQDEIFKNFFGTLKINGHQHLIQKILRSFERRNAKEEARTTITITSAHDLSDTEVQNLLKREPYKNLLTAKHKKVLKTVDETLITGSVVRSKGTRADGSGKRLLWDFYQSFITKD